MRTVLQANNYVQKHMQKPLAIPTHDGHTNSTVEIHSERYDLFENITFSHIDKSVFSENGCF